LSHKKQPLLRRLNYSPVPAIALNKLQRAAIVKFNSAIKKGMIKYSSNPCLCGGCNDIVIGYRDRYGLDVTTVLCKNCGLMRTDPYLDYDSIRTFYRDYYRPIYVGYPKATHEFFEEQLNHGQKIFTFLNDLRTDINITKVYEIGCGAGGILEFFKEKGLQVAGCDLGSEYLEYGKDKGLQLDCGNSRLLEKYGPADLVILCHVLEHIRDPGSEVTRLRNLLKPGGLLYVEVPGILWTMHSSYIDFLIYLQNAHVYNYCLKSLDFVMSQSGFKRIRGTEQVKAVYQMMNVIKPQLPSAELDNKIVRYLRWAEIAKSFWPGGLNLRSMVGYIGRRVLGNACFENLRKRIHT